jgi:DNA-binding MarR family transcriptional regulator
MAASLPTYFDTSPETMERRIATGLYKLGLAMKHQAWLLANEEGISPTQGQILAILSVEGARSATELSTTLGVTVPTISDSVRALVDKGLAARTPDPRHPRASLIGLTPAGRSQAARVRTWPDFLASAAGALSGAEQDAFLSGLVKMIRTLQENGQIPTSRMCATCTHFRPNVHEGPLPHHCGFVDAPMASRHMRIECGEHEVASPSDRAAAWERFVRTT